MTYSIQNQNCHNKTLQFSSESAPRRNLKVSVSPCGSQFQEEQPAIHIILQPAIHIILQPAIHIILQSAIHIILQSDSLLPLFPSNHLMFCPKSRKCPLSLQSHWEQTENGLFTSFYIFSFSDELRFAQQKHGCARSYCQNWFGKDLDPT